MVMPPYIRHAEVDSDGNIVDSIKTRTDDDGLADNYEAACGTTQGIPTATATVFDYDEIYWD
jgi:hypothetical protein